MTHRSLKGGECLLRALQNVSNTSNSRYGSFSIPTPIPDYKKAIARAQTMA